MRDVALVARRFHDSVNVIERHDHPKTIIRSSHDRLPSRVINGSMLSRVFGY